jgi:hypothetical protein
MSIAELARFYAIVALEEVASHPEDYGITEPWKSVGDWVDYEMQGDAGEQFTTDEERRAVIAALKEVADLKILNAPFGRRTD